MLEKVKNFIFGAHRTPKTEARKYIFGATTAIITNMALIIGLHNSANAKMGIIGGLLVIAIADNISDALGIHIYQEAEDINYREVWIGTFTNFLARFFVSLGFILIVWFAPADIGMYLALSYGLTLLAVFSVIIARIKKKSALASVIEHLGIAIGVMVLSKYVGGFITKSVGN